MSRRRGAGTRSPPARRREHGGFVPRHNHFVLRRRARSGTISVPTFLKRATGYLQGMNTNTSTTFGELSDSEVLARIGDAARDERRATARLIALLIELDARRLYLGEGCSSLFTYCAQILHLSEHAAYNRIGTARAARRFPAILDLVECGAVTLTAVRLLAPHLTEANHRDVLERARHKSKREVELLVATLSPRPDVPSMVRKLPAPATSKVPPAPPLESGARDVSTATDTPPTLLPPSQPTEMKPVALERYKIQFTSVARRMRNCGTYKICSGTPSRTAMPRLFLNGP
jgi:hypothetical protein